jgi:hypothetical protein
VPFYLKDWRVELNGRATRQAQRNEVLNHLLLAVHGDRATVRQLAQGYSVALIVEPYLDSPVHQALSIQPIPRPHVAQELGYAMLDNPRPHSRLNVLTTSAFEDDVVDAIEVQNVAEQ